MMSRRWANTAAVNFAPLYPAAESYLFRRPGRPVHLACQYPEAKRFAELLAGHPSDTSLLVRMGNLYLDQNQYASRTVYGPNFMSRTPRGSRLGRLYRQKGDLDRAATFSKIHPLNPTIIASASLASLLAARAFDQAITAYRLVTVQSKITLPTTPVLPGPFVHFNCKSPVSICLGICPEINPANLAAQDASAKTQNAA
jgi:hypothetical protein